MMAIADPAMLAMTWRCQAAAGAAIDTSWSQR